MLCRRAEKRLVPGSTGLYCGEPALVVPGSSARGPLAMSVAERRPTVAAVDRRRIGGEVEVVVGASVKAVAGGVVAEHLVRALDVQEFGIGRDAVRRPATKRSASSTS